MSDFERRLGLANKEMEAAGISNKKMQQPVFRFVENQLFSKQPSLYQPLWKVALKQGLFFAVFWGGIMYLVLWHGQGLSPSAAMSTAALAGAMFGATMAGYMQFVRKRHHLSAWDDL